MKFRLITFAAANAAGLLAAGAPAQAQDAAAFFKDKTVTMIIGANSGGGYDTYARLVARHIGKHVPGKPNVVSSNMPGASSNTAAAALQQRLAKDGTYIGAIYASALLAPLLGQGKIIKHDPAKFRHLGSASREVYTCVVRADAPLKTYADARQKEIVLGATTSGGSNLDYPVIANRFLGTKFKVVRGYRGSRAVTLAIEQGEVQGACGLAWSTMSVQYPDIFTSGKFRVLAQEDMDGITALNARNVPVTGKMDMNAGTRQALDLFYAQGVLGRPYVVAAEVPEDRAAALQKAFMTALADPALLAEAKKMRIEIAATSGNDVQKLLTRLYATPKPVIDSVVQALGR
ncbi:MAG: Bug family tripartite tricarboxylate transporter substrate binding protein [Beijerinckiaceae bacterium]